MAKNKEYKVWVEQVNATCLTVKASSEDEARDKAYREWRKEFAHSYVSAIELNEQKETP